MTTATTAVRYPLDRLARVLGISVNKLLERHGISGAGVPRMREVGVLADVADRIACAEGWNPLVIWPEFDDETRARAQRRRDRYRRRYEQNRDVIRAAQAARYRRQRSRT